MDSTTGREQQGRIMSVMVWLDFTDIKGNQIFNGLTVSAAQYSVRFWDGGERWMLLSWEW